MPPAPQERSVFGRYRLLQQLGQGGMAQIWLARANDGNGREVVVKTLHPRLLDQPLFAELFAAEARISRLLSHPGVVKVVEHGEVKGMPFLAMERIDGWDLGTLYRALPGAGIKMPIGIALAIGIEMCRAVGHAHGWRDRRGTNRPIVHGDLSPSNLMVRRDGGVTLIDFGVAHMNPRVARGRGHVVIGKSGYLAPELLDDKVASPRSDVFSAGVMLHELFVGRHLFVADSERETLRRVSEAKVAPPSRSNPDVTSALDEIVLRALERIPARRFANANELAEALERLPAPERATRDEVAELVVPVCSHAHRRSDEPATSPIAPAIPASLMMARAAALPMQSAWHESTGTINERPRRRPVAEELEARARRQPPRVRRGFVYALVGAAAMAAALWLPLPSLPFDWSPLAALDMITAVAPTRVVDEAEPSTAAALPAPSPARPLPGLLPPPLPPRVSAAPHRHLRRPRHLRHARLGLVDPFRGR